MADSDDRVPADDPAPPADDPRPVPARPPVIEARPAAAPDAAPGARDDIAPIDSSLVGEGGLPAAERAIGDAPRSGAEPAERTSIWSPARWRRKPAAI